MNISSKYLASHLLFGDVFIKNLSFLHPDLRSSSDLSTSALSVAQMLKKFSAADSICIGLISRYILLKSFLFICKAWREVSKICHDSNVSNSLIIGWLKVVQSSEVKYSYQWKGSLFQKGMENYTKLGKLGEGTYGVVYKVCIGLLILDHANIIFRRWTK